MFSFLDTNRKVWLLYTSRLRVSLVNDRLIFKRRGLYRPKQLVVTEQNSQELLDLLIALKRVMATDHKPDQLYLEKGFTLFVPNWDGLRLTLTSANDKYSTIVNFRDLESLMDLVHNFMHRKTSQIAQL